MARSPKPAAPAPALGPPGLAQPRPEVAAQLQERIDKGKELQARPIQSRGDIEAYENDAQKWREYNSDLLVRLFTDDSMKKNISDLLHLHEWRVTRWRSSQFAAKQWTVKSQNWNR
jgi:hypothetical protein